MRRTEGPALVAARLVLLAAVWVALTALLAVAGLFGDAPAWLLWPAAIAATATATWSARVAAAVSPGSARRFWRRLTVATAVLTAGTVSHATQTVLAGHLSSMNMFSAGCYLGSVAIAGYAMARLPRPRRTWRANLATCLDIAVVGVAAALLITHFVGSFPIGGGVPPGAGPVMPGLHVSMMLIMLVTAVTAILAVIRVGITGAGPVHGPALWFLAPAGLLPPISWLLYPVFQGFPHLSVTAIVLAPLGLMFALAAHSQIRSVGRPARPRNAGRLRRWRRINVVPYAAVAITVGMLIFVTLHLGYLPPGLAGGSVVLITLVVIRQIAALSDNTVLLDQLEERANHDDLTGLPNRRMFAATLQERTEPGAVAVGDLDGFGTLNDRLGDERGDALLRAAAARIAETFGPDAFVARLLGDEFGILVPGDAGHLGERLVRAFRQPLQVDGHDLLVTVTVGVAAGRDEAVPDLLRRAELALKSAKRAGANHFQEHTAELDDTAQHDADLAAALRRGLEMGEFRLAYQPIVELPGGRITGVEALIRWSPPDGPPVSPVEFIPVAEQTGMILDLGLWVIETACADAARWQSRYGAGAPRVNINVSARQLLDPELPDQVASIMARYRLDPDKITLEITETAVFGGGAALSTVHELRGLGVGVALDDFGTGQSSLTLLRTCPVTTLKVDKSFIDELNGTAEQEAIATSLSTIAATLGLRAVAEGVETYEQAVRLEALGYRYAQGYYFAKPGPAALIDAALEERAALEVEVVQ
ncbi:bifunctional diguanylate cyclase/phosphodiesterase [Actinoplanes sp. L3-i22]|uniref:putative bifunctional diguanylate cyclase/phosphodiesterase n=1 Tax=Actinoplanes sp. L3-i22 TaxID=2836373 RepID=UPI001C79873C|nr:bifunctional diguanylate cyclase/phosphodiesterase [Actinoplanes sp. L3-i22]BCY07684.1 bifunctional diguanylate cyclase/phosphodiesterase [Actinoplanes sp. L3-i22]